MSALSTYLQNSAQGGVPRLATNGGYAPGTSGPSSGLGSSGIYNVAGGLSTNGGAPPGTGGNGGFQPTAGGGLQFNDDGTITITPGGGGGQQQSGPTGPQLGVPYGDPTGGMYQYYDPTGGMGYGNGFSYPMVNQGNLGVGALMTQQYAAQQGAQGQIGAAQAGAQGQIGAAQAGAQGTIGAATQAADAAKLAAQLGLTGVENTNQANQGIAQTQAGAQTGVAGINAGASNYAADKQLAGQTVTADDAMKAALAGIANQVPLANAQNAPAMLSAQTKSDLLKQLFSGGGGTLGALSGLGGGTSGAAGGTGGGVLGGGVLAGLGITPGTQPAVPTSTPFNSEQVQQNLGAGQAKIDQQIASLRNQLLQKRGGSGMSSTSLPPGLEMQLQQQGMNAGNQNALNWENFANQTNNQNNLAYGGVGLNQYNQNIQNALAALGLSANAEGSLLGALT